MRSNIVSATFVNKEGIIELYLVDISIVGSVYKPNYHHFVNILCT